MLLRRRSSAAHVFRRRARPTDRAGGPFVRRFLADTLTLGRFAGACRSSPPFPKNPDFRPHAVLLQFSGNLVHSRRRSRLRTMAHLRVGWAAPTDPRGQAAPDTLQSAPAVADWSVEPRAEPLAIPGRRPRRKGRDVASYVCRVQTIQRSAGR